jgi:uncharacterized protein YutE (UPF0331/DUF86 family)
MVDKTLILRKLAELDLYLKQVTVKMDKMAKFRNIVVHHYGGIDAEIVVGILKKNLEDFSVFRAAIVALLEKEQPKG